MPSLVFSRRSLGGRQAPESAAFLWCFPPARPRCFRVCSLALAVVRAPPEGGAWGLLLHNPILIIRHQPRPASLILSIPASGPS